MSLLTERSRDGFGGHAPEDAPPADLSLPYGPRSLGATTDGDAAPAPSTAASSGIPWNVQRLVDRLLGERDGDAGGGSGDVHAAAAHGTGGPATALPHLDTIQRAFGHHDVGGVEAHVGGAAREGAAAMGAQAFAAGNHVAFAGAPDLHTAAHEAAHVVQQRGGVQLYGGVGEEGDVHERHADAVADRVVAGESAEDLLDEHAPAGAAAPAGASVQRQQLTAVPNNLVVQHGPAQAAIGNVDAQIAAYNVIDQDQQLAPAAKAQQAIDQLRVLDRACYAAMTAISNNQFEMRQDPRTVALHAVLVESEREHRRLVADVLADPQLANQVDCFDAQGATGANGDLSPQQARQLWTSVMNGGGKIKLVGPDAYQEQVRSWLTKLMDTKQGRRMLAYLDTGDATDLGTNVYIGAQLSDLPPQVRLVQGASNDLKDPGESVAQPLLGVDTRATLSQAPVNGAQQVQDARGFNEVVLTGGTGVTVGANDYEFGDSSGSLVVMKDNETLRTVSGVERNNLQGVSEAPEVYQPDWVLLGHELGHSVNMRAGATTEGKKQQDNPTDVFAETFTGIHDRDQRQNQWFGGSEEYINIVGHENELRAQGGLDQRDAHTGANGRELQKREPAMHAAFQDNVWAPLFEPTSPTELARQQHHAQQKHQILTAFLATPRDPQHLVNARQLGDATVALIRGRAQQRNNWRQMVAHARSGDAARNALDANRPYEATLQGQYDHVMQWIADRLIEHPDDGHVYVQATRMVYFCQRWLRLRQAHDAAGLGKQFKLKAWWDKAKRANHSVGDAIVANDDAKYQRKNQRVLTLINDYS